MPFVHTATAMPLDVVLTGSGLEDEFLRRAKTTDITKTALPSRRVGLERRPSPAGTHKIVQPLDREGRTTNPVTDTSWSGDGRSGEVRTEDPAAVSPDRLRNMDREVLLEHLRRTRFSSAGRERAQADAHRIAAFLRTEGARRVIGFGSVFAPDRRLTPDSDLDVAVEGLPPGRYFSALAEAREMTAFPLDLLSLETALDYMRESVRKEGVSL